MRNDGAARGRGASLQQPYPIEPPPHAGLRDAWSGRPGCLLVGLLLAIGGTISLLEAVGLWRLPEELIGPIALILVGAFPLVTRDHDHRGGR